jgi:ABC-type multidrug transport system fused ATPase/permease subunit
MPTISVIFYALLILCVLISFGITLFVLGAMWLRRSMIKTDRVNYLLLLNGYMDFIVACPVFLDMSIRSIYGHLHPESNFDGWECLLKGLVYQLNGCVYFYSFLLQAIYRFCRIVHPERRLFQSFTFYAILSVAQWIVAIAFLIVCFLLGYIAYLPDEYHCQFVTSNLHGSFIGMAGLFVIPFALTLLLYFYAMYYVRTQTTALTTINRDANIRRDLIVLTRLVLLFSFVSAVGLPHLIVPVSYAIFGDVASWAVPFTWLMTFVSLASVSVIQIFVSPHLRKLFARFARIHQIPKRTLTVNNN